MCTGHCPLGYIILYDISAKGMTITSNLHQNK